MMEGGNHGEGIGEGGESGAVTPFHPWTFLISNKFKKPSAKSSVHEHFTTVESTHENHESTQG